MIARILRALLEAHHRHACHAFPDFDTYAQAALDLANPQPPESFRAGFDELVDALGELDAVETVDDLKWLWGVA